MGKYASMEVCINVSYFQLDYIIVKCIYVSKHN